MFILRFNEQDKVVKAPDAMKNKAYKLTKEIVSRPDLKKSMVGTREEVLTKAAKVNRKRRFVMPSDSKAHYTDHLIQSRYHCLEIDIAKTRSRNAVLFVFGGGMILGSDRADVGLSRKIAITAGADVWFPYYPMCHKHDMLENVRMIFECYAGMLKYYAPEHIVLLGFSSGAALILDLITYINELNDKGESIPMPGLMIPVSPGSVPVTDKEKRALHRLADKDILVPEEYMYTAREIMRCGRDVPEKYLATAHGDFRNAPVTHFYYGSAEALYAFAPSYAESFRMAGAECIIHVGKGMHHCYALQYFIPGCKPAFNEIMQLIVRHYTRTERRNGNDTKAV